MLDLKTEPLFDIHLALGAIQEIGPIPTGKRTVYVVDGGSFEGPKLKGTVLSGADWVNWISDATQLLDVRLTLETDDGALIYMTYDGIIHAESDVAVRLEKGEAVAPDEIYFRTTPRFETGSESYGWLNRLIAVGVGKETATSVDYRVYAVL